MLERGRTLHWIELDGCRVEEMNGIWNGEWVVVGFGSG